MKEQIEELLNKAKAGHPFPWKAGRHVEPTVEVLYILDANGGEVTTFYGEFRHSASAIELILGLVNEAYAETQRPQEVATTEPA